MSRNELKRFDTHLSWRSYEDDDFALVTESPGTENAVKVLHENAVEFYRPGNAGQRTHGDVLKQCQIRPEGTAHRPNLEYGLVAIAGAGQGDSIGAIFELSEKWRRVNHRARRALG